MSDSGSEAQGTWRRAIEERAGRRIGSLRRHAARGTLVNSAFLVVLSGIALAKGFVGASYLTPAEFGVWGFLNLALLSVLWLRDVGINDKYIQQSEADQAREFKQAFTLSLMFMAACALAMGVIVVVFSVVYDLPELLVPGLVLSSVLIAAALQFPAWAFYRRLDYARQRLTQGVEPLVGFGCAVVLLISGMDYWALVIGAVAGAWAGACVAVAISPYALGLEFERGTGRRYLSFAWPVMFGFGVTVAIVQISYFVGELKLGIAGVGALALVGYMLTFTNKADAVLTQTLYPAICAMRDDTALLLESFVKSNRLALMWGFPFGVGLALFAEDLIHYVIGDQWEGVVTYLQLMAVGAALNHVAFNWTAYYRARGETRPIATVTLLGLVVFLAIPVPLLAAFGLNAFGAGMLVFSAGNLLIRAFFVRRLFASFSLTFQLFRAALPTLLPLALVLGIRLLVDGSGSATLAAAELGVFLVGTAVATVLFERDLLREATGYLRRAGAHAPGGAQAPQAVGSGTPSASG